MPSLEVHELDDEFVYRDVIQVNIAHRVDKRQRVIKEGQVCLVHANGRKCLAILRGYQLSGAPNIYMDEYTRHEKLGVKKNESYDFEFKRVGYIRQLLWAWNATEMGYQVSSRLAILGFVAGIVGLVLGIIALVDWHLLARLHRVLHSPEVYDTILIGIAAFLNLGLTYAGLRVAVRPIEDEKAKSQSLTAFFLLCVAALGTAVWIAVRATVAQTTLQTSVDTTHADVKTLLGIVTSGPTTVTSQRPATTGPAASKPHVTPTVSGFLQFAQFQYVTEHEFFTVGKPLQLNVYYVNRGKVPANNAFVTAGLSMASRGSNTQRAMDKAVLDALEPQARAVEDKGSTVGVDNYLWTTPALPLPLTQQMVDEIMRGQLVLYVVSYARWTDTDRKPKDVLDCVWLNPPTSDHPDLHSLVWQNCNR
jgi:hypothetical protein